MDLPLATEHREKVEAFQRKHRTAVLTLLFTDIVGSVKLKQDLGDSKAVTLIQDHHAHFRELLRRFPEAEEIDQPGDSFFVVFVRPSDAVRFALSWQASLRLFNTERGQPCPQPATTGTPAPIDAPIREKNVAAEKAVRAPILDRIGIHIGEVVVEERPDSPKPKDLYGIQVDTAARVMSLAEGNQILLTRAAFDNARPVLKGEDLEGISPLSWMNHGPYLLKGVEEPLEICEVGETDKAVLKPPPDSEKVHRYISPDSEPVLGWRPALGQAVPNTQWLLERKLGEGGFGEVWVARNEKLKERRVFKFCFRADRVRSLKRELALFQILKKSVGSHPNIVGVQDVYFDQPPYYLVMDYGEGQDLQAWCEAQGGVEKVPLATRLEIVAQVADALQAAHDAGVIHRDVKPSNILVSDPALNSQLPNSQPSVKLTDFGIGQVTSEEVLAGMTRAGFSRPATMSSSPGSGTLMYMAPELLAGRPASIRCDIYSLGVVLFQLLAADFTKPVTPDWAKDVPDPLLREDLEKCFAGNPQDRFAGAQELAQRLRALPDRRRELAQHQAEAAARERAAYRKGVLRTAAGALGVVLVIAALALFALRQSRVAKRQAKLAEAAATETRMTLALSDFLQAVRLISEDNRGDALAYLSRSLSANPTNDAALTRLETLLTYQSWLVPTLTLKHSKLTRPPQFSPDGRRIVTVSSDSTARVWDAQSGEPLTGPLKHNNHVTSAQFSPDGKRVLTASDGYPGGLGMCHEARVWDAQSGQLLTGPLKHKGSVSSAQFSPDGKRILTASSDGTARVWDAQRGQLLAEPLKDDPSMRSAQFSPDGKRLVTASSDGTARVWDAQSSQPLTGPLRHNRAVGSAEFSPDGKRILTASADGSARVWEIKTGQPAIEPLKHNGAVMSAQFSSDGKRILTASSHYERTGQARVWDAQSGQPLTDPLKHPGTVTSAQFSPDGKRIVVASWDGTARVWDTQSGPPLPEPLKHKREVISAQFSPDGTRILTASEDYTARVWDAQTGQALTAPLKHNKPVHSARFSPDGRRIVTACEDETVRVWDAQSGQPLTEPLKHGSPVRSAQFSPDGRRIVTASYGGTARVWDAESGQPLTEPLKHNEVVWSAQFSPDGKRLVTASDGRAARVWDAESGQPLTKPLQHKDTVRSARFGPDGERIVTASEDKTARVWDAQSGQPLTEPLKHTGRVWSAEFSPDGKRIVTASDDNTARVWDARSGQLLTEPLKHNNAVWSAQFSPDGKRIVTASYDRTVRVWDAGSGQPLTEPMKHGSNVVSAQFSPDGKQIVTASSDHTARVWDVAPCRSGCPEWLLQLSEAISGQVLNKQGVLEATRLPRLETIKQIREKLSHEPGDDDWVVWGRWFLADPATRTISPFSKITVPQYIENRIKESTAESLAEAEQLAYGNTNLLARISEARSKLEQAKDSGAAKDATPAKAGSK